MPVKVVVFGPERRTGVLRDGQVVDGSGAYARYARDREGAARPRALAAALVPADLAGLIESGPEGLRRLEAAVDHVLGAGGDRLGVDGEPLCHPEDQVTLHAPLAAGARVACAGGNYGDHAAAMAAKRPDARPFSSDDAAAEVRKRGIWGFWKVDRTPQGAAGEVIYPARTQRLDYEGEVAVVLGRRGKDIAADADWRPYVWGVTLVCDWSVRDANEGSGALKFAMQKNFDTCLSLGPCIVVGEVDPANVDVETLVNGERRQRFNSRSMIFSFGEYMAHLSKDMTLYPGDVISGGTSAGTAQDSSPLQPDGRAAPEKFLKVGDRVEVRSPAIGTLAARIVAKEGAGR
jgi:2-keto-4-pentenoate hydratase/2-oxohepta-3-ene-1,7-dioic acid hydratase in catechol pathway